MRCIKIHLCQITVKLLKLFRGETSLALTMLMSFKLETWTGWRTKLQKYLLKMIWTNLSVCDWQEWVFLWIGLCYFRCVTARWSLWINICKRFGTSRSHSYPRSVVMKQFCMILVQKTKSKEWIKNNCLVSSDGRQWCFFLLVWT